MNKKTCTKCDIEKYLEEFNNSKKGFLGKVSICKECLKKEYEKKKLQPKIKIKEKVCNRCGKNKNIEEYSKNKSKKDGHINTCKSCINRDKKEKNKIRKSKEKRKKGAPYTTKTFNEKLQENLGEDYELIGDYISGNPIKILHKRCNKIRVLSGGSITSVLTNSCKYCNVYFKSNLSQKVENTLRKIGADYETEVKFKDCKNILPLSFDFAIYRNNKLEILIEADGEQHFKKIGIGNLEYIQYNDKIKNEYCKNNNIPLLRISYLEEDAVEEIVMEHVKEDKYKKKPLKHIMKNGLEEKDIIKIRNYFLEKAKTIKDVCNEFNLDSRVAKNILVYKYFPTINLELKSKIANKLDSILNPKRYFKDLDEEEQKAVIEDRLNLMSKREIADKYNMYYSFNNKLDWWDDILKRKTSIGKKCRHKETGIEFTSLKQGCDYFGYIYGTESRHMTEKEENHKFEYIS